MPRLSNTRVRKQKRDELCSTRLFAGLGRPGRHTAVILPLFVRALQKRTEECEATLSWFLRVASIRRYRCGHRGWVRHLPNRSGGRGRVSRGVCFRRMLLASFSWRVQRHERVRRCGISAGPKSVCSIFVYSCLRPLLGFFCDLEHLEFGSLPL